MSDDILDLDNLVNSGEKSPSLKRISLVNPTSKNARSGGKVGYFNVDGTNQNLDMIIAVPAKISMKRIWFLGNNQPYFCRSDNGVFPVQSSSPHFKQQGLSCDTCPKSQWKGKTPPACQQAIEVTFCDLETGEPFVMDFKGTSLQEAKKAIKSMSDDGGISTFKVQLEAEEREAYNGNRYYTTVFSRVDALSAEESGRIAESLRIFKPKAGEDLEAEAKSYQAKEVDHSQINPLIEIDLE